MTTATSAQAEALRAAARTETEATKEDLKAFAPLIRSRAYQWASGARVDTGNVDKVLKAIFGPLPDEPPSFEIPENVRNYIVDVTVRQIRENGWCGEAEEALAEVLDWAPEDEIFRDSDGYDCDGYNEDGFDRDGFDQGGWSKDGFDRDGFDRAGRDRDGFNHAGVNRDGLTRAEAAAKKADAEMAAKAANRRLAQEMIDGWTPEFRAYVAGILGNTPAV